MSEQPLVKDEAQLSDEQLNNVAGGANERFRKAHEESLADLKKLIKNN